MFQQGVGNLLLLVNVRREGAGNAGYFDLFHSVLADRVPGKVAQRKQAASRLLGDEELSMGSVTPKVSPTISAFARCVRFLET